MRFETVSQPVSMPGAISRAFYFQRRRRWRPALGAAPFMVFVKCAGFSTYLRPPIPEIKKTDSKSEFWAVIQGNYFAAGRGFPAAAVAAAAAA